MSATRPTVPGARPQSPCLPLLAATAMLVACGGESTPSVDTNAIEGIEVASLTDAAAGANPLNALYASTDIPYPVYPNGSKYRVGGENGLKIVVFETEDSFDKVDAYYKTVSQEVGMPRLLAMNDYVRYSSNSADEDPWATYRPGIVIHEFNDDDERQAVGARQNARTNIIMSF